MQHKKSNKVLGAGRLFFEETDAQGVPLVAGEVYLGDSPGFSLTITTESIEELSSDGPMAEVDIDRVTRINRNFSLTTKNINADNLAMFVIGDAAMVTQSATPVTGEAINGVLQGRYYQLGVSPSNPTGVRGVTSVTVQDDAATPNSFTAGEDYELDAALGRIYIIPGGGIADDTNLELGYTPVAETRSQITTNNLGAKFGRLRYVEDATFGRPHDVYAPFVQMTPTGELAFKSRDTVQQVGWDVKAMVPPAGGSALYIDGRAQA